MQSRHLQLAGWILWAALFVTSAGKADAAIRIAQLPPGQTSPSTPPEIRHDVRPDIPSDVGFPQTINEPFTPPNQNNGFGMYGPPPTMQTAQPGKLKKGRLKEKE